MSYAERIIFLDIDGPMIPSYSYIMSGLDASYARSFSPVCVKFINMLCDKTGAKIVFNSYHNYQLSVRVDEAGKMLDLEEDLRQAAIRNGVDERHIHTYWRTKYASPEWRRLEKKRIQAIMDWVREANNPIEWVAIDDEDFTVDAKISNGHQVLINFDQGILLPEYNEALGVLKPDESGLIVL